VPGFSALVQCEFHKTVLNAFPGQQAPPSINNIPQGICFVALNRFLPVYTGFRFKKRSIQIINIRDTLKAVILRKLMLSFRFALGLSPLVTRIAPLRTRHISPAFKVLKKRLVWHPLADLNKFIITSGLRSMPHNVTKYESA
jgi:hypothetical protein